MTAGDDRLLTVGEVAKLFGVRPETVIRWIRKGRISYTARTLGGHHRFKASDVEALLRRGGVEGVD